MRFDAIVVPRGAEARAVERGWPLPRPALIAVAVGSAAGSSLIDLRPASCVLVIGMCGALDPTLRVGDALPYSRVIDGSATVDLDVELAAACAVACDRAPQLALNVAHVVGGAREKAALRAGSGAAVVDMEAAVLLRTLRGHGARVAMVRVVSDDAAHDLPDLRNIYDAGGGLRPAALAIALVRAPLRGARFIVNALFALRALRATAARLAVSAVE